MARSTASRRASVRRRNPLLFAGADRVEERVALANNILADVQEYLHRVLSYGGDDENGDPAAEPVNADVGEARTHLRKALRKLREAGMRS